MKKIILVLFCLTLNTAIASAENYSLTEIWILDSGSAGATASKVYVLQFPGNTRRMEAFKTFDSKVMEDALSGLPRGSVVTYDVSSWGHAISPEQSTQFEALKSLLSKKGVSLIVPNGAD
jgi:hypothetical protein